ncbi:MAG TPA: DoxX family protein [Actinomycetota bacterium]|jgi:putative oxidoreductase
MNASTHTLDRTTTEKSKTDFDTLARDVGLLAVRASAGLLLAGHGAQKLFGWFGGPGLKATAASFAEIGWAPGKIFATLAGASELGGGLLLALGLLTPLGAAAMIGVMFNAVFVVTWSKGPWVQNGGFELGLLYGIAAFTVALTGPGRLSLDWILDRSRRWVAGGALPGLAGIGLGVAGALIVLAAR